MAQAACKSPAEGENPFDVMYRCPYDRQTMQAHYDSYVVTLPDGSLEIFYNATLPGTSVAPKARVKRNVLMALEESAFPSRIEIKENDGPYDA